MNWEDVSERTRDVMKELGNFGPTVDAIDRAVKGWTYEDGECGKTYWTSDDLRQIAAACIEAADWLDRRAELVEGQRERA